MLIPKMQSVFAYRVTFCHKMKNKILQIMLFEGILKIVVTNNFTCLLHLRIKLFYLIHLSYILYTYNFQPKIKNKLHCYDLQDF